MAPRSNQGSTSSHVPMPHPTTTLNIGEPEHQKTNRRIVMIFAVFCCLLIVSSLICLVLGSKWFNAKENAGGGSEQSRDETRLNSKPCYALSLNGSLVPSRDCPVHMVGVIGDFNSKIGLLREPGKNDTEFQVSEASRKRPRP